MRVPTNLRRIRGDRSIADIEHASGVNRGTLSRLETGRGFPSDKHVDALEQAYGATIDEWYPPKLLVLLQEDDAT